MLQKTMFYKIICPVFVIIALMACSPAPSGVPPETVASRFYEALKIKDYSTAASLFVDTVPLEQRAQDLQAQQATLADLQGYEHVDTVVNTVFSGTRYTLKYRIQYSDKVITEQLIMFENVSGDPLRIEVRNIKRHSHTQTGE